MRFLAAALIAAALALPAAASDHAPPAPAADGDERPSVVERLLAELAEDAEGETRRRLVEALEMVGRADERR